MAPQSQRRFARFAPSKVDKRRRVDIRASDGGDALLALYRRCGLMHLPADAALPPSIHRPNDGRYFYAHDRLAEALAAMLDASR